MIDQEMNKKIVKHIFTDAIILFPILNSAHIGDRNIGFGDIFLVMAYGIIIIQRGLLLKLRIRKADIPFWIYIGYLCFISIANGVLIKGFELSSSAIPLMRYIFYGLVIVGNKQLFDTEHGIKLYISVCVAETIYGYIQYVLMIFRGIVLPFVLPFTTMEYGVNGADYNATLYQSFLQVDGFRFVGFFPEASHFAEYTLLAVILVLFKRRRSYKDIVVAVMISIAIVLTKSSIGIFGLGIIFGYYLFAIRHISTKRFLERVSIVLSAVLIVYLLGNRLELIEFISERLRRITEQKYAVSGNVRLLRGLTVYRKAPLLQQIFGIGAGNYANFVEVFNITTFYDLVMDRTNEFMNAFSLLLIRSGLVGTTLYALFCAKLFSKLTTIQFLMGLIWIELFFTENIFFTPIYVLYLWFLNADIKSVSSFQSIN